MEQQVVGLDVSKAWLDGYWRAAGDGCASATMRPGSGCWSGRWATAPPAWW